MGFPWCDSILKDRWSTKGYTTVFMFNNAQVHVVILQVLDLPLRISPEPIAFQIVSLCWLYLGKRLTGTTFPNRERTSMVLPRRDFVHYNQIKASEVLDS